jgi:hypothetical protein
MRRLQTEILMVTMMTSSLRKNRVGSTSEAVLIRTKRGNRNYSTISSEAPFRAQLPSWLSGASIGMNGNLASSSKCTNEATDLWAMKSIIAAKMSSMRKLSALSSSAASSSEITTAHGGAEGVPKEPSSHYGKMRVFFDGIAPTSSSSASSEKFIGIILTIAVDSVHAVTDKENSVVFEADFAMLKEIIWDHTECSLCFVTEEGTRSASFLFSSLVEVEAQMASALRSYGGQRRLPDQVYVGALVGRYLPSSPIHQRRASSAAIGVEQPTSLPTTLRREMLAHERPPRSMSPRERLALQYFKSGILSFSCSINGEARGLKLDGSFLFVFPSPDYHERSACLFSYQYGQVDACEVRAGVRLELRFHRSGAKQPLFIAFYSPDAQYIRDAIWYWKHGMSVDEYYRKVATSSGISSTLRDISTISVSSTAVSTLVPPRSSPARRSSLKSFQDEDTLWQRIQSRCVVIGCTRRCADLANAKFHDHRPEVGAGVKQRDIWLCEEHAPATLESSSPPRSPSKHHGFLSRGKSSASMSSLIHAKHYLHSVKYHGTLLKSGGKYQMTKAWNLKIVALIGTPVGGFLCYYDRLAHCPGQPGSALKERRVIDLSGVICIRRESVSSKGSSSQPYAFDVVTVYRTWTFAASDIQEYEIWLNVLGEAVEKQSSMSPDTALRFPVKCLRDPLHNLPSRNDGTTSLEVSPNGVTVCSGTDGESEVYNWYFTEIQKWSVGKQHDSLPCCFLSCAVDSIGGALPQGPNPTCYQDFLFQTSEADAICNAIEFFVGRCMAKLEILGIMHRHPQSRQSSRHPSLMPAPQKLPMAPAAEERSGKIGSAKEHAPVAVPLRPIRFEPPVVETECACPVVAEIISDSAATPGSIEGTATMASSVSMSEKLATPGPDDSGSWLRYQVAPPMPTESRRLECIFSLMGADHSRQLPSKAGGAMVSRSCSYAVPISEENVPRWKPTPNVESQETQEMDGPKCNDRCDSDQRIDGVKELDAFPTVSSIADASYRDDNTAIKTLNQDTHQLSAPNALLQLQPDDESTAMLGLDTLKNENREEQGEGESDRFVSFEYCECTVGAAEAEQGRPGIEVSTWEEDDFEDARCDAAEAAEVSVILIDGFIENEEDSLIVMEDDEFCSSTVDMIGDSQPNCDPVDEIAKEDRSDNILPTYADADDYILEHTETTDESMHRTTAAVRITIPPFTTRKSAEHTYVTDFDGTLPGITVYSVTFRRGRLQRK